MTARIQKILLPGFQNNRGSVLLVTYLLITTLLILGAAFLVMGATEAKRTEIQHKSDLAFYIAEAGIERAIYDLKQEFEAGDKNWSNGITVGADSWGPNTGAFYDIYVDGGGDSEVTYPSGAYSYTHAFSPTNDNHYKVKLRNVGEDLWIRSTGEVDGVAQTIQVYVKIVNVSPWNNAIFGGAGSSGTMINGNVNIYGSVHILGNGLDPGDDAINLGGTAELVGNNYNIGPQGMSQGLKDKIPDLPTVILNEGEVDEETVDTLNAELRVKNGVVSLSGNSAVGEENDDTGNTVKETIDGAYVTDGYGGSKGTANVHSDNGTNEAYDLGDAVSFPSLDDDHPSDPSKDYYEYFAANGLVLTDELEAVTPGSTLTLGNCASNCVFMNADGNLQVEGLVYISAGNNLSLTSGDFEYTGKGTILVTGNVAIDANLVTSGDDSFPSNIMAIMTPNNIAIGATAQKDVMGLFFAENEITANMQTDLVGTVITNKFNFTNQVPSIFQVPLSDVDLPPGIIANETIWYMNFVSWQKCDNHTATCGGV